MDLATGALGNLGPKLLQLLEDEYKVQTGVRKQVRSLADELTSMHAALSKVAQVPFDQLDPQVKLWASEVREASYDMEDIIDTFLVRVDGGDQPADDQDKFRRLIEKMGNLFGLSKLKARHGIAVAIEGIKEQINEMGKRHERYNIDGALGKPYVDPRLALTYVDPRLASMYTKVTELVGIDKALGDIISMLEIKKMVSIVGIGGSGKTSLAKASYEKLSFKYDCKAFVSVGRSPNLAKLFMDILYALDKWKYENIHITGRGAHLLVDELREFLKNKRYLMVIDDVWENSTWNMIAVALVMDSNCDYRVITTTRNVDVAKKAGDVYNMDPLSEAYSKELFCTRIGIDPMNDQISSKEVEKILKKCGGIPLSIIIMASLLADKPMTDWNEVYDSIGFGHECRNEVVDNMEKILLLSYYDLPPHLKTCLLYLRIYPEDKEINKEELIWRWIGEGFINREGGKELFQVAEIYFSQLINKSMIQPVYSDYDGLVYSCRVHDMVLDLICNLATEANFVRDLVSLGVEHRSSSLRRLTLHGETNQGKNSNLKATHMVCVRSINAFSCPIMSMMPPLSSFKVLSVLSLENCEQGCDLKHLGKLLHLRHLGCGGRLYMRSQGK